MDNSERKEAVIRHHLKHILEQPFRIFVIHFKPCDHVAKRSITPSVLKNGEIFYSRKGKISIHQK